MKANRWIRFSIGFTMLLTGGYLITGIYSKIQRKNALEQVLSTLPDFNFTALDGGVIRPGDFPMGQPVILLFFSPDCEFCQTQAKNLNQYLPSLDNIQLLWVTSENAAVARAFAEPYGINQLANCKIATVPLEEIRRMFGIRQLPFTLIYSHEHRLVMQFSGETKWEALISAAKGGFSPDN